MLKRFIPLLAGLLTTLAVAQTNSVPLPERAPTIKPLDLKFTAVDGAEFDLAKWRGKVVLVDFWATWCGPCRRAMPAVVNTYRNLHAKGFEVVGISLDQNREQMLKFIQANAMPWPQYFDGLGWRNKISTRFGVDGIPTMWLVDKTGRVRTLDAGENLEMDAAKLLAE